MTNMAPSRHRPWLLAAGVILALAALGVLVFTQSPWAQNLKLATPSDESNRGTPSIAWTPDHLTMDGDDTVSVTLTAQSPIPATQIEIVPLLAPYLSVSPAALPALAKGATQILQIAAKVPAGTPMDTLDGTLHLRSGSSTIARPLPITLRTWGSVEAGGVSVIFPPELTLDARALQIGFGISLNNFGSNYQGGGVIPWSGMQIEVVSNPAGPDPLEEIISADWDGVTVLSTTTITLAGFPATMIRWSDEGGKGGESGIAVYVPRRTFLTKIYLTFNSGDENAGSFEATFEELLTLIQLN